MLESLKSRPVSRLPDQVRLAGRILYLADDAEHMRQQLEGHDLD